MSKRAQFRVVVAGTNITPTLSPVLISLTVSNKVGTHADTASLEVDDTNGRIVLPQIGAPVVVALGWEGEGLREVFAGTADEVRSSGSRNGRTLSISAKGIDTTGKPKEPQQRHFDGKTIEDILREAGKTAGIKEIQVDPDLRAITRQYFDMRDESFIHMGERMAREVGGNFRVQGSTAFLSKRGGAYTAAVVAAWGKNLHGWDMAPALARAQFGTARARWYDAGKALWQETEEQTSLGVTARHEHRYARASEAEADQQAASDRATSERDAGEGSVTIEGDTGAIPDGLCIITGARAGVDGHWRIDSVTHNYSRSGGFITSLDLKAVQGGAASPRSQAT